MQYKKSNLLEFMGKLETHWNLKATTRILYFEQTDTQTDLTEITTYLHMQIVKKKKNEIDNYLSFDYKYVDSNVMNELRIRTCSVIYMQGMQLYEIYVAFYVFLFPVRCK